MSSNRTQTVDINEENYKPMPGEIFFHKIETDRRKYMISLRKTNTGVTLVIADQLKNVEPVEGEEKSRRKVNRVRIYDEAVEDFLQGINLLSDKLAVLKKK